MVTYRRIKSERIKKYAIGGGIVGVPLIFLLFSLLVNLNAIEIISYSGDMQCRGTIEDPCIANIIFKANTNVYIYPMNKTEQTWMLESDTLLEEVILKRSWGSGYRTIDLSKPWSKKVKYALKLKEGQIYNFTFFAYKKNPEDTVKWSFGDIDPFWFPVGDVRRNKSNELRGLKKPRWVVSTQTGEEENYNITFEDPEDIDTKIYLTLNRGVDSKNMNLDSKDIYDVYGRRYTDDKDNDIRLIWSLNSLGTKSAYVIDLGSKNFSKIDKYIKFGDNSIEFIYISSAQHLDSDKNFIDDVFDEVSILDNNFTIIPKDDYIRIEFERELTELRDITIWANSTTNQSVELEFYIANSTELLGSIQINKFNLYQFFLTNLTTKEELFDLRPVNGDISFDYITDPTARFSDPTGDNGINQWNPLGGCTGPHAGCINGTTRQPTVPSDAGLDAQTDGLIEVFDMSNIQIFNADVTNITVWMYALSAGNDDSEGVNLTINADARERNFTVSATGWHQVSWDGSFSQAQVNDLTVTTNAIIAGGGSIIQNGAMYVELTTVQEECFTITSPGEYHLTGDIINSTTSNCITIRADDVIFDCEGNLIDGNDAAQNGINIGLFASKDNVTIKNCRLSDWNTQALFSASYGEDTLLLNLTVSSNPDNAISLKRPIRARILNSTFETSGTGIKLEYPNSINVTGNIIRGNNLGIITHTPQGATMSSYYNNLFNNSINAEVRDYLSYWNTTQIARTNIVGGSQTGGNFWASPIGVGFSETCLDADENGICDESYDIADNTAGCSSINNCDFLPLATADESAPTVELISPANRTVVNGNVTLITTTTGSDIQNVLFLYTNLTDVGAGQTVLCNETVADWNCLWDTTIFVNNTEGYSFNVTVYDFAENVFEAQEKTYFVDRTLPQVKDIREFYPPGQISARDGQIVSMSVNISDAPISAAGMNTTLVDLTNINGTGNTTMFFESGSKAPDEWSNWNMSVEVLGTTGLQDAVITAVDNATPVNNQRSGDQFNIQIDNYNPTWGDQNGPNEPFNNTQISFFVNAFDNFKLKNYTFATNMSGVWINDSDVNTITTPQTLTATKTSVTGNWSFKFYFRDDAGNQNNTNDTNFQVLGNEPGPLILLGAPIDGSNYTTNINLNFTASYFFWDADNCSLQINGVDNQTILTPPNQTELTFVINISDALMSWSAICSNNTAQFASDETRDIFVDTTGPTWNVGSPENMDIFLDSPTTQQMETSDIIGTANYTLNESLGFEVNASGFFKKTGASTTGLRYFNITAEDHFRFNSTPQTFYVNITEEPTPEPEIEFVFPSLDNGTITVNTTVPVNVSITDENIETIIWTWNETNFTIMDNTLLSFLNFDNVSTLGEDALTVIDFSTSGDDGIVQGATPISEGRYRGAYQFDGVNDVINFSDVTFFDGLSEFSFEIWMNKTQNVSQAILSKYEGSANRAFVMWGLANEQLQMYFSADGGGSNDGNMVTGINAFELNEWNHIVAPVAGEDGTGIPTSIVDTDGPFIFGTRITSGLANLYNGTLDEFRFWNKMLFQEEVTQHFMTNLYKYDTENWALLVNQTKNVTAGLDIGNYTYSAYADDDGSNENSTLLRSVQIVDEIAVPSLVTNVSLFQVEFEVHEIVFNSPTYITIFEGNFSLTSAEHLTFKGVGAARKFSGGGTSTISLRLTHNEKIIFDSDVRSMTQLADRGVFNIPINDSIAVAGNNNITLEAKEVGPGSVNISSLEIHIDTDSSNTNAEVNHTLSTISNSFSSTSFINIGNLTIEKSVDSFTVVDIQHTVTSDGTSDIVNCYLKNNETDEITPTYSRWLENSGDTGSTGMNHISKSITGGTEIWQIFCNSDDTNTITNNITGYLLSLTDEDSNTIQSFQNETLGTQLITGTGNKVLSFTNFEVKNSSRIQLMSTVIIQSTSGKQDGDNSPFIFVNSSSIPESDCFHGYARSFSSNSDIGTIETYVECNGVSPGNFYNFSI